MPSTDAGACHPTTRTDMKGPPMPRSRRLDDQQAHKRALDHLARCVGDDCAERVCWDPVHHLQGHLDVDGTHLVVIAPRDDEHDPLVLSEADWDALRHGGLVPA